VVVVMVVVVVTIIIIEESRNSYVDNDAPLEVWKLTLTLLTPVTTTALINHLLVTVCLRTRLQITPI